MSTDLQMQIRNSLDLRESEDLLDIWQENDRVQWSDYAFVAIRDILTKRGVELPEQDEPIYKYEENSREVTGRHPTEQDITVIDDANAPAFYDPGRVVRLTRWLDLAARAVVSASVLNNMLSFPAFLATGRMYSPQNPNAVGVYIIATIIFVFQTAIGVAMTYLPLMALSRILKILMEMEFSSRKPAAPTLSTTDF